MQFENTPAQFTMIAVEGNMGIQSDLFETRGYPVRLSDYWLCEVPVTQIVWEFVLGSNPSSFKGAKHPVVNISWLDIADEKKNNCFLSKLNKYTVGVRPKGTEYRLPTEAQWEYAARGGKYLKKYSFDFSGSEKLNEVGWFDDTSRAETKPVGLKNSNLLGLYDMSGNVWEWCYDWNGSYQVVIKQSDLITSALINPTGMEDGSERVLRGGGFFSNSGYCLLKTRFERTPSYSFYDVGFRLALVFT
jgi:formylglycine-generating enzyme